MKRLKKFSSVLSLTLALSVLLSSCANKEEFLQVGVTDDYTQDLNPPYVDILWMVNDRSPMNNALPKLIPEATEFFKRLDSSTQSYRMGFASADMEIRPGQLRPIGISEPLQKETRSKNTLEDRAAYFRSILNRYINLSTGPTEQGLDSVVTILNGVFVPRPNVPLVVVFVSDSFDKSTRFSGNAVDYYEQQLLSLKGGRRDLIRVYSINYKKLVAPEVKTTDNRCATYVDPDADTLPDAQERYFKLAKRFAQDTANPELATGTLCKPFANQIDISGLRMKEFTKRFSLKLRPNLSTLTVTVFLRETDTKFDLPWTYDAATNEVVFTTAPPEGSNIQISYFPG